MRSVRKSVRGAVAGAVVLVLLSACGSAAKSADDNKVGSKAPGTSAPSPKPQEKVKLSVVSLRPGYTPEAMAAFMKQVEDFEKKNPNIDLDPKEYDWNAVTFQPMLAGGQVPTVFDFPFTDGGALIQRKQIADLTEHIQALPYAANFNPNILKSGQAADGKIYAIPTAGYANALHYNRELFKAAGLDPDKPPTTWDEVRTAAKAITEKTGKPGYVQMTKDNTGGWMLTTMVTSMGGRMETVADGKATATVNSPQTKQALELLRAMRWDDNSMGANMLHNWPTSNADFGAGKFGMYTQGADVYTYLVQQVKVDPKIYGITTLPLADSPEAGTLTGGTLTGVVASASDAEKQAAVTWIDYYYLRRVTIEEDAVRQAKIQAADKQPVGTPQTPLFDQATLDKYNEWVKDYVNVPLDQMKPFTDNISTHLLVAEMPVATQAVYGILDQVVQSILTKKDANIDDLLTKANADAQKAIDKAEREIKK